MPNLLSRRLFSLGSASLGAAVPFGARAAAARASVGPPLLGAILPTNGRLGLVGDEAWRGIALAYAALPPTQRPSLLLVTAETTRDAQRAVGVLHDKGAALILGTASSTLSFAATESAELANIAYLELDAPADGITKRGFRSLHRFGTTSRDAASAVQAAITGVIAPGWRIAPQDLRIGLLFDIGATDGAFAAAMLSALTDAKITPLLPMATATGRDDLDEPVRRMRRAQLDLVIHAGQPDGAVLFYQAMARAGWRPRMVIGIGAGYALDTLPTLIGAGFDRTMVVASPNYGPASASIAQAYQRRYATQPRGAASLQSYLGAQLAFQAVQTSTAKIGLAATLTAMTLPAGSLANGWGVQFDADGQNQRSFNRLQQWQKGALRPIEPGQPGAVAPILAF